MEISPAKLTLIVIASIIVGIAIAIVVGFVGVYSMFTTGSSISFGGDAKPTIATSAPYEASDQGFLDTTNMTWGDTPLRNLPELSTGEARIVGSAKVDGQPVAGLRLRMVINGKVNSAWAATDASGRYEIPVPPGKYSITGFEFDRASANKLLPGKIMRPGCLGIRCGEGRPSDVNPATPGAGIDFEFIDPVNLLAPEGDVSIGSEITARWKPYPGAVRYRVSLYETPPKLSAGSTSPVFDWKARPEVTGDSLDLIKAGLTPKAGQDYAIKVEALDDKGAILSESPGMLGRGRFRLMAAK